MSDAWTGVSALWRAGLRGAGVGVGHLDSGVDASHPALAEGIAAYRYFDVDGRVVARKRAFDDSGHGTHTAGIVAGRGLSGRLGIAPGCRLHVAHVLEHGRVLARVVRGLDWLIDAPIRVLAMPLGVRGGSPLFAPLLEQLAARDILAVAPIGNLGPGCYHMPGGEDAVLSVGAIDDRGRIPRFCGSRKHPRLGCVKPDLLAPGVDIESAEPGGGLEVQTGTSMAAAFVAGVAALLFEACPEATARQVASALTATARPLSKGRRHRCRTGVVDPAAALAYLQAGGAVDAEHPIEPQDTPKVDPRLLRQMRWTPEDAIPAIASLSDCTPSRARRIVDELGRASSRATRVLALRHGGLVLLEAKPDVLAALAERPELRYLSAQDVDLG